VKHLRPLYALVAITLLLAACSSYRTGYNKPPRSAASDVAVAPSALAQPLVVLEQFGNPKKASVGWRDIGAGMSTALADELRSRGKQDVVVDAALAKRLSRLDIGDDSREERLAEVRRAYPNVRYVVTGQVTDFAHTADLPEDLRRSGLFGGKKSEAIVAIRFVVRDLEAGRIIASDHVYATASAPKDVAPKELYAGMAFGTYMFWSSPLGLASESAIKRAVDVLEEIEPVPSEYLRVVKQIGPRRVQVTVAEHLPVATNDRYFVCVPDPETRALRAVYDVDTESPVEVQIDTVADEGTTAWLIGRPPADVELRGALLSETLPPPLVERTAAVSE